MPLFRVHPDAISHPYFLGLADLDLGVGVHISGLYFELSRPPQIVGIQKGHISSGGPGKTQIAGGGHSSSCLGDYDQASPVPSKPIQSAVPGTVVYHDQLELLETLLKD